MRLRIAHCILSGGFFGSERYAAELAAQQIEDGHEVLVIARAGAEILKRLDPRVRQVTIPWFARRPALDLVSRAFAPDVIHAHLSAACKLVGPWPARAPSVATLHVGYKAHQHAGFDGLIALNETQMPALKGFAGRAIKLWNFAPKPAVLPPGTRERHRLALGLRENDFVAGFAGRLHEDKDPILLIEAFRAAAPGHARLVLAGDGPLKHAAARAAQGDGRILFAGYRDDVPALMQAFDLFVLPSRREPFGLVVLEAMTAGLPAIAARCEGPAEFLANTPVHLFTPGDKQELEQALRSGINAGPRRVAYDLSAFSRAQHAQALMRFYRSLSPNMPQRVAA